MAGHGPLHDDLMRAAAGKLPRAPRPFGFGGSYNYGRMRNATAIIAGDDASREIARLLWLRNEADQLRYGHWTHGEQCEAGCPQPHLEFNLEPCLALWRWALENGDTVLAAACEADTGRCVALWRRFNVRRTVCMPGGRAKDKDDPSNDQHVDQWRQRPADVLLAMVEGERPIRYEGPAVVLFRDLFRRDPKIRARLLEAPEPFLAFPIYHADLRGGGYVAWIEKTNEAVRRLGRDPLNAVVCGASGQSRLLVYDWGPSKAITELDGVGEVRAVGAIRRAA